jgi:hypothetical protein
MHLHPSLYEESSDLGKRLHADLFEDVSQFIPINSSKSSAFRPGKIKNIYICITKVHSRYCKIDGGGAGRRWCRISNQDNRVSHGYLKDTIASGYKECSSCKNRTQSTCVKCRYCYTCHSELLIEQSSSEQQKRQRQTKVIDVHGQQVEPICSYRTCHHKFSVHGHSSHMCKCRHPLNYATGVSISPLAKEES